MIAFNLKHFFWPHQLPKSVIIALRPHNLLPINQEALHIELEVILNDLLSFDRKLIVHVDFND